MRKKVAFTLLGATGALALGLGLTVGGPSPSPSTASSHREAPLISQDPTADNTDLYAFRSPDKPDTLSIVSNWIPGEDPAAGPNYYTFSDQARYNIFVDKNGDGKPEETWRFRFKTAAGPYFLGNTVQTYTVTRNGKLVGTGTTPPNNIGPRQVPNYAELVTKAVTPLADGTTVFAGQRDDPFFGDVGAIFDLVAFRKGTGSEGGGKDFLSGYGVHSIALQLPISQVDTEKHTIGIWSSTDRLNVTVYGKVRKGWSQVSRLGNPLINEVIIPTNLKDAWNRWTPNRDATFEKYYTTPILAAVMNKLYKLGVPETGRDDLKAVLLTGIPDVTFTGSTPADELRINLAIPVTAPEKISRMGVLGGDNGGFPNGRRLTDDVIDIEEQAVAGFLKGKKVPLGDGVDANDKAFGTTFPYLAAPDSGYDNTKAIVK